MLKIKQIFENAPDYVIVRCPEGWPDYVEYSDIDILVKDINAWITYLKPYCQRKIIKSGFHIQMDYMKNGKLSLKFDLYSRYISDKYMSEAFTYKEKDNGFYVVSERLNNVSKCYEYLTYDKNKHKEFIKYKDLLDGYTT